MPHMLYSCDCGKPIHLPAHAGRGYVWSCRRCGRAYVVNGGWGGRRGILVPSLPPQIHDMSRICCECGRYFVFTAGEQHYFAMRDLTVPKRCPSCRKKKPRGLLGIVRNLFR